MTFKFSSSGIITFKFQNNYWTREYKSEQYKNETFTQIRIKIKIKISNLLVLRLRCTYTSNTVVHERTFKNLRRNYTQIEISLSALREQSSIISGVVVRGGGKKGGLEDFRGSPSFQGRERGISRRQQSIKWGLLKIVSQSTSNEGWRVGEVMKTLQNLMVGDQVNFIVTQLKSSKLSPRLPLVRQ